MPTHNSPQDGRRLMMSEDLGVNRFWSKQAIGGHVNLNRAVSTVLMMLSLAAPTRTLGGRMETWSSLGWTGVYNRDRALGLIFLDQDDRIMKNSSGWRTGTIGLVWGSVVWSVQTKKGMEVPSRYLFFSEGVRQWENKAHRWTLLSSAVWDGTEVWTSTTNCFSGSAVLAHVHL